jgi:hypothetical protein
MRINIELGLEIEHRGGTPVPDDEIAAALREAAMRRMASSVWSVWSASEAVATALSVLDVTEGADGTSVYEVVDCDIDVFVVRGDTQPQPQPWRKPKPKAAPVS